MSLLPQFQSDDKDFQLMQNSWGAIINPVINNPSNKANILKNVALVSGTTTINHLLGRNLQGWRIIGINGAATIYDSQKTNQTPNLTLVLVSSAAVTVNLEVF